MSEVSYSLNDSKNIPLDKKLDSLFKSKKNGFFIELGAFDGLSQSNTAFFEFYRNWNGLLIEPSKDSFELCIKNRPNSIVINAACVSNDYTFETVKGDFNGISMASVDGVRLNSNNLVEVKAISMKKILDDLFVNGEKEINFLSIDTEGYELNVLKGLELNKYRPNYILIEIYNWDYQNIYNFLEINNYALYSCFSNYNYQDNPIWDGSHNDYLFYDKNK